jgi:hypothetical protein
MRGAYLWPSATEHSFAVYTLRVLSNRFAHLCAAHTEITLRVGHALRSLMRCAHLCASHTASMPFFKRNPFRPTDFSSTAKKSKQKKPLSSKSLIPARLV